MRCEGYRLYTIMRSIIEFTESRGGFERYTIFLIFLFLLVLSHRRCVIIAQLSLYRAHTGDVNILSQRFDNRLKMPI